MTKYFRRNKNVSEPFICHDCKQEKKNTKWFGDLKKEGRTICFDCYKKWHNQNRRPKIEEKSEATKNQSISAKKENNASLENTKDEMNNFKSIGKAKKPTLCFVCQKTKSEVEFFTDFWRKIARKRSSICKDCLESRIKYYREKKKERKIIRKKKVFNETKNEELVEKEKNNSSSKAEKNVEDVSESFLENTKLAAEPVLQKSNTSNFDDSDCGVHFKSSENMPDIEDNTIDLIITSPPYFNIKDYSKNGTQDLTHSSLKEQDVGNIDNYPDYIFSLLKI